MGIGMIIIFIQTFGSTFVNKCCQVHHSWHPCLFSSSTLLTIMLFDHFFQSFVISSLDLVQLCLVSEEHKCWHGCYSLTCGCLLTLVNIILFVATKDFEEENL